MPIPREDILEVIEGSMFPRVDFPEEVMQWHDWNGVMVTYSPQTPSAALNAAGLARLDESNADATIAEIKAYFEAKEYQAGWVWSELSTPPDLPQRIEAAGFVKIFALEGMVLDDLNHHIAVNPAVTVREAGEADSEHVARLYRDAYPMDDLSAKVTIEWFSALGGRTYLAYLEGHEDPVAVSSMFYYPGKPVMALQGAATLESFRGNGIYTALMARRLDDARKDGMEAAILQADVNTSAPICARLGFEKIMDLVIYVYPAPEGEH